MAAAHAAAGGKPYRALVMCPNHLIGKWAREIQETIPDARIETFRKSDKTKADDSWQAVCRAIGARRSSRPGGWSRPAGPEWFIIGRNQSKYDPDWAALGEQERTARCVLKTLVVGEEPALDPRTKQPLYDAQGRRKMVRLTDRVPCCPKCGQPVRGRKGVLVSLAELGTAQQRCASKYLQEVATEDRHPTGLDRICPVPSRFEVTEPGRLVNYEGRRYRVRECGEPLWSWTGKPRRWAPARFIQAKGHKLFDFFLLDEMHEERSDESAQSMAAGKYMACSQKIIGLTGTLIGGKADDLLAHLIRMTPQGLRDEGFTWGGKLAFAKAYGRIDTIVTSRTGDDTPRAKRRGSTSMRKEASTSRREAIRPGIMPTLFGRHLIGTAMFLGLEEMSDELPDLVEETVPVALDAEQAEAYAYVEGALAAECRVLLQRGCMKLLGTMLYTLLGYPDRPFGWEPEHEGTEAVGYYDKPDNSTQENWIGVVQPPELDSTVIRPKEQALVDLCRTESAEGRQAWVFVQMTNIRDVQPRLKDLLEQAGLRVKVLRAGTVDPKEREAWIARNGRDADVIISHPGLVSTGLDLFSKEEGGHNFATIIFYETGYDLFTLRQASRRAWRIGQPRECRIYYLYYQGTMQQRAMTLMGKKLSAASALEGKFSAEGLAALAGEDNAQMALARSLSEKIEDEQRHWAKVKSSRRALRAVAALAQGMAAESPEFAGLSVELQMLAETILASQKASEPAMEEPVTIPLFSRDELAGMFAILREQGIRLEDF
jgi:hypothetical protein